MIRTCTHCKIQYFALKYNQRYCSPMCWADARDERRDAMHYGPRLPQVALLSRSKPTRLAHTLTEAQVEEHRRVYCARYANCLDHAHAGGWISWSCKECPVVEELPREKKEREDSVFELAVSGRLAA